jgi:hypothetical protein
VNRELCICAIVLCTVLTFFTHGLNRTELRPKDYSLAGIISPTGFSDNRGSLLEIFILGVRSQEPVEGRCK